ncbi:hypothetical protein JK636_15495 [Clostridium sp. YIM B02515]|uniref:Lipoprotein n=1 Tax=Clostridium rhizosphaerae TaxID=2803861 RepID=A0ABS1TCR6_9CLOT|nr:hypothetical protein [Clostridium rhizosphaerae]MBL4937154.1 hypothetical protein [Clostridium rhizosphaerae]
MIKVVFVNDKYHFINRPIEGSEIQNMIIRNLNKSKIIIILFIIVISVIFFYGCAKARPSTKDNKQNILSEELKKKAKVYKNEEYQNGEVPLETYIKMEDKILQTNNKDKKIVYKGDRFILENNGVKYQVFSGTNTTGNVDDQIIIYGTYYVFIKSDVIEKY